MKSKGIKHIDSTTERKTRRGEKKDTLISPPPTFKVFEEQPYFRYHGNHSCLPLFLIPVLFSFFSLNPSHPPLLSSFMADSKYNCEPLRLALCSPSFGVPQRRRASTPLRLWGKSRSEVCTRGFLTPRTRRDSCCSTDAGRNTLIPDINCGFQYCVHKWKQPSLHLRFQQNVQFWRTGTR